MTSHSEAKVPSTIRTMMSSSDRGCSTCGCSCGGQSNKLVAAQGYIMDTRTGLDEVDLPGRDLQGTISFPDDINNNHDKRAGSVKLNIQSFSPNQEVPSSHSELGMMRSGNGVGSSQALLTSFHNEEEEGYLSMKSLMIMSDSIVPVFPSPPSIKDDSISICYNPLPAQNIVQLRKLSGLSSTATSIKEESTVDNKVGPGMPKPNVPSWLGGTCTESGVSGSSSDTDSDNLEMLPSRPLSHKQQMNNSEKSVNHSNVPPWLFKDKIGEIRDERDVSDTESELGREVAGYESRSFWPRMIKETAVLKLGDWMEEKEGVGVEYWDVDDLSKLCPTTLAVLLCGMLNSGSGVVWAGVGKGGKVKGCEMGRMQRDKIRQMLDKVCSCNISPRVGPRIVDIDFVKVEGEKDLWLVKYTVRLNMEVLYRVKNIDTTRFNQGVYVRNNTGPDYTEFVSEDVLKIIQNNDQ